MKSFLTLISLFFLCFGSLQAQNVNNVVDKNNVDEELLIYLIIERVNEVRAFKSLGELELNEICRLAAMDQATFISIANEIVYEQQKEGMESTSSRVIAYGGGKKSKVAENLHMIELDPTFTYIDLSDEIASAWLMEKKANKNIEGKNFTQYGIGLSVLPDENMLYVSLVFGSDAVGKDVKLPVEEEEVIEVGVEEDKILYAVFLKESFVLSLFNIFLSGNCLPSRALLKRLSSFTTRASRLSWYVKGYSNFIFLS